MTAATHHKFWLFGIMTQMKTKVETPNAPTPPQGIPYSQAIVVNGFIFVAGHIATTPDGTFIDGTIEEQTVQVMKNLEAVLAAAGTTFKDVVKTTIFLANWEDYAKMNDVYGRYMSEPYPARETVAVKELPRGAKVEISMIAVKP